MPETIKVVDTGKLPGLDGIPVGVVLHDGKELAEEIHRRISVIRSGEPVPQDWADASLEAV